MMRIATMLLVLTSLALGQERMNVLLIVTDDQGGGDYGFMGNELVDTPHLDALAASGTVLSDFYVNPVCAPTRASIMTGRYAYRTRVVDTWLGRAMMEPEEWTVAEALEKEGYATGIFGKWHLGDCFPMRPEDQGFQEVLVHRGGGIGQPSDPPGHEARYTNPALRHNGEWKTFAGYCTDVYFDEAMRWIGKQADEKRPFFAYVATNAPHGPFGDVPQKLYEKYRKRDLSEKSHPLAKQAGIGQREHLDRRARIFAMIENVDQGVGRLLAMLERRSLSAKTLVLFMTDNGPNGRRFVGRSRGMKSEVFEGGIRTPLLTRLPGQIPPGRTLGAPTAHIDLMPTILAACRVDQKLPHAIDGKDLWPQLTGADEEPLEERTIVIQSHRGDVPVRDHHFALRRGRWKLCHPSGFGRSSPQGPMKLELYDLEADPFERANLAAANPERTAELLAVYRSWFGDVSTTRKDNDAPPRIVVGSTQAPTVTLTRQDWRTYRTGRGGWGPRARGYWNLRTLTSGPFTLTIAFPAAEVLARRLQMRIGDEERSYDIPPGMTRLTLQPWDWPVGEHRLEVLLREGAEEFGVHQVTITRSR